MTVCNDMPVKTGEAAGLVADINDLESEIAYDLSYITPDFAAIVEVAHARDPRRVPYAARVEAERLAPIVALGPAKCLSSRTDAGFAEILRVVRVEVDVEIAQHVDAGLPPMPSIPRSPRWSWGVAAAAAAIAVAFIYPTIGIRTESGQGATQAPWWDQATGTSGEAGPTAPGPQLIRHGSSAPDAAAHPGPPDTPPAAAGPAPAAVQSASPRIGPIEHVSPVRRPRERGESPSERMRRLDAEAEQAWQAGDHVGAQRRYREIIGLAPGSQVADLSYGDLFTLARQHSMPRDEVVLWREYLAAFPRGRFADNARAGLCRRESAAVRRTCWQGYLADFPEGAYRPHAARALEGAPP